MIQREDAMGGVPSTPRRAARLRSEAEGLLGVVVGEKPVPLSSNFWQELLELPLTVRWPEERVLEACQALGELANESFHLLSLSLFCFFPSFLFVYVYLGF